MVRHQHPRVDLLAETARQFRQPVPIENIVPFGIEDRLAAIAALDDVQRLALDKIAS